MTKQRGKRKERGGNGNACGICRAAAVLLALGLGFGGVCAAAEDPAGTKVQSESSVQAEEKYGTMSGITVGATVEGLDNMSVLFEDEEEVSDADVELVPEAENEENPGNTDELVPEISVEAIQTGDGDDYDGYDLPGNETETVGNDMAETGQSGSVTSGECGAQPRTVYWVLDEDGVLTVSGSGSMADWESVEQTPWYPYLEDLRKIVIAEGVASVGAHAFCGAQTVDAVELPQSIERVGAFAFCQCGGFGSVTIG